MEKILDRTTFDGLTPTDNTSHQEKAAMLSVHERVRESILADRRRRQLSAHKKHVTGWHDLHSRARTARQRRAEPTVEKDLSLLIGPENQRSVEEVKDALLERGFANVEELWQNIIEKLRNKYREKHKKELARCKKDATAELNKEMARIKSLREKKQKKVFVPEAWNKMDIYARWEQIQRPRKQEWMRELTENIKSMKSKHEMKHFAWYEKERQKMGLPEKITKQDADAFAESQMDWLKSRNEERQKAAEERKDETLQEFPFAPKINPFPRNWMHEAQKKKERMQEKQAKAFAEWEKTCKRHRGDLYSKKNKSSQTQGTSAESGATYADPDPKVTRVSMQDPFLKRVISTIDTFSHVVQPQR